MPTYCQLVLGANSKDRTSKKKRNETPKFYDNNAWIVEEE